MIEITYEPNGTLDADGLPMPAYGFVHEGVFIIDPRRSACDRFEVDPLEVYDISSEEAERLVKINMEIGAIGS